MLTNPLDILNDFAAKNEIDNFLQFVNNHADLLATNGFSLFHFLITNKHFHFLNHKDFFKLLKLGDINYQDQRGNTALHLLLMNCHWETEELKAINQLILLGASLAIQNKSNCTPLSIFYDQLIAFDGKINDKKFEKINQIDNKNFLVTQKELQQFNILHQLYVVFGGQKIDDEIKYLPSFFSGGKSSEARKFLQQMLELYFDQTIVKKKHYLQIINIFNNYYNYADIYHNFSKIIKSVSLYQPILTESGFNEHLISTLIERTKNDIILTIADKGTWSEYAGIKAKVIQTLHFQYDEDKLRTVLAGLYAASFSTKEHAHEIIFSDIPELVHSNFRMVNSREEIVYSSPYKIGICFFANHKLMLRDLFDRFLPNAKMEFKHFDLFLHQQVLANYKKIVPPRIQNKALIHLCETIISQKNELNTVKTIAKVKDGNRQQMIHRIKDMTLNHKLLNNKKHYELFNFFVKNRFDNKNEIKYTISAKHEKVRMR